MKIRFNRTGSERKTLVTAIGEVLETKPVYRGAPTFIYDIKGFEVDKEGTLTIDDSADGHIVKKLLDELKTRGFVFEKPENTTQVSTHACDAFVIEIPKEGFTDIAITNLENLIESKGVLIKKALGVEVLPIEQTEDTLRFPWFEFDTDADKVKAYTYFISGICDMAKEHKRINAKAKEVDNEKYAFRCFLLRLGFIGAEFKTVRKILLSKLTGSSAFKNGTSIHEEVAK
ncbi:MAG: hypothetical protein BWY74_02267 [Firmicutes bacterium ADurb.Bin419]|nr:MAG: hypothetical protein BWY74_02267 [Firmicutes bacterium ADurb.Bin419]